MFSLQFTALESSTVLNARIGSRLLLPQSMSNLSGVEDYALGLTRQTPDLLDYIHGSSRPSEKCSGGVALCIGGVVTLLGATPGLAEIAALSDWLIDYMPEYDGILTNDRLGKIWPAARTDAGIASGLPAVSILQAPSDPILWFRPELIGTTLWAGNPVKAPANDSGALFPRNPFAT